MKFTKEEKSWIMYDVSSSAFTMIITTTLPIYFANFAKSSASMFGADITALWGTVTSISILILAALSPILGAIADYQGMKKKMFVGVLLLGFASLVGLSLTSSLIVFLVLFVISRLSYTAGNVFYDSMLTDVTSDERMDAVSASGYAWGYIGSCIPFIVGIVLIIATPFGMDQMQALQVSFLVTAAWWLLLSIPIINNVHHTNYLPKEKDMVKSAFRRIFVTLGKIKSQKKLAYFILAYFCYIDGVYTIISMATSYGSEVGIDSIQMILALLITQFVAFPCVILVGRLSKTHDPLQLISIFILAYIGICLFGFQLDKTWEFWTLAVAVGMVMGGIQTLSRSYFAKIIPKDESNEYFGFLDIFGKFADFMGPLLLSLSAWIFGVSRYGILFIMVLFIVGFILLQRVRRWDKG